MKANESMSIFSGLPIKTLGLLRVKRPYPTEDNDQPPIQADTASILRLNVKLGD